MAASRAGLVAIKKQLERDGKSYEQTFYVRPQDLARAKVRAVRAEGGPAPRVAEKPGQGQARRLAGAGGGPAPDKPPVAASVKIPNSVQAQQELKPLADKATSLIGQVHSDGVMPPVYINRCNDKRNEGEFTCNEDGSNPNITVQPKDACPQAALVHELGHMMDLHGMGKPPKYSSDMQKLPEMKALVSALDTSKTVERLRGLRDENEAYVDYLMEPGEQFARAYTQYIAMRTGDKAMLAYVRNDARSHFPNAWPDKEFKPIADRFDKLFVKLRWRT